MAAGKNTDNRDFIVVRYENNEMQMNVNDIQELGGKLISNMTHTHTPCDLFLSIR